MSIGSPEMHRDAQLTDKQSRASQLSRYVQIARPDHWIKNVFVLPGMASAVAFTPLTESFWAVPVTILSTCLIASANYTINEFLDSHHDRHHPTKSRRPGAMGLLDWRLVILEYILLAGVAITLISLINVPLIIMSFVFLSMGLIYNIPPLRTKDYPYLDVLSESINNPIRFLLGWFAINSYFLPPSSILFAYWMGGAYLMAMKRYSEYRRIDDRKIAMLYRKSFAGYSKKSLLLCSFFYALCASFFIGVFLIKYKAEFVLTFPLFAVLFTWYLWIALKPDSAAQAPETLYHEFYFLIFAAALFVFSIILFYVEIPFLALLSDTKLIPIRLPL